MKSPSRALLSTFHQQIFGSIPLRMPIPSTSIVNATFSSFSTRCELSMHHHASIPHDRHTIHTRRFLSSRGVSSNNTRKPFVSQTVPLYNSARLSHMHISTPSSFVRAMNSHFSTKKTKSPHKMIPRKAALHLTPKARETFRKLIAATKSEGIMLKYEISSQHALRMAFKFDLIKDAKKELTLDDEGVSLEVLEDGITPKPPAESWNDNLPKLYIHHGAFMKVLGGTLDVELNSETGELKPKLFDRNGYEMDPNA